jgi:hypothetical protein
VQEHSRVVKKHYCCLCRFLQLEKALYRNSVVYSLVFGVFTITRSPAYN